MCEKQNYEAAFQQEKFLASCQTSQGTSWPKKNGKHQADYRVAKTGAHEGKTVVSLPQRVEACIVRYRGCEENQQ